MYRFFVEENQIDKEGHKVYITGEDVNHIKNVLRMKIGEEFNVSDQISTNEYRCRIESFEDNEIICSLCFIKEADNELQSRIYLLQGLPKQEKMELVVQKAVELGAAAIIPVACHRSVVKLDDKKAVKKVERWQAIAQAAAKQAKRGYVPKVYDVMSYREAASWAKDNCEILLLPYELAEDNATAMEKTRQLIAGIEPGKDIAIMIGPEGGFEDKEVAVAADKGFDIITLGRRILRTETAGLMVLSWLVLQLEGRA